MANSLLFDLTNQMYAYSARDDAPGDAIFEAQAHLIRDFAAQGDCVIVGRCSDYVLREHPNCLRVFLHAPLAFRLKRIMETEGLAEQEAREKIARIDRRRAGHYRHYTRCIWGHPDNYHLSIDTSLGEDYVEEVIVRAMVREEKMAQLTSA